MRLWQGRLQGFRTESEITPAIPAPRTVLGDLLPALGRQSPPAKGCSPGSFQRGRKWGFFPLFWGQIMDTGELPAQQGQVRSCSLKHP